MISGANDSTSPKGLDVEYSPFDTDIGGVMTPDKVISSLKKRRENIINGGVNCIPLPFERFKSVFPGIEQGQYSIITASTKIGKTQIASYIYLYNALEYAYLNPGKCRVHILYFCLEESPQRVMERYMSHLLWKLSGFRVSPQELRSTSTEVPEEALKLLETKEYQDRLNFFNEHVQFETEEVNPTGIRNVCINYAKTVGTVNTHKIFSNGDQTKEVEVFDSYVPNDPNLYNIVIVDHMSLIETERGYTLKGSMDKLSEYFVKYLRNRYGFTIVAIQQQAFDTEGLEAIKQKKLLPTAAGLSDTKYTSRDADIVLGLFSPDKFGLPNWNGYDITKLRGNARFMQIIANRNGSVGDVCPLFFDGATCSFQEMPRPDDVNAISQYYLDAESLREHRHTRKLLNLGVFVGAIFKKHKLLK